MSLQQAPQSRVFVELVPWADRARENNVGSGGELLPALRRPVHSAQAQTVTREVHVSGTAEVSASPDRAQVAVLVSSTKEAKAEAKKSVCRRLDYITQSLQQQGLQAENVTVTKDFRRVENAYHMEAEVCITFTEFGKMQNICNFLVEKLDSSVVVSQPQFYHTPGSVENLRHKVPEETEQWDINKGKKPDINRKRERCGPQSTHRALRGQDKPLSCQRPTKEP
ncbi:interleukin-1 receptor-associated kinase 1-binding protein 1 isoform X4 [Crocuta crocuta]